MTDEFTKEHTNYCKGIAIILMITHHLFWNIPGIGISVGKMAISQRIGIIGKVCVSIFLMLSGLGLYKSTREMSNKKEFYIKKLLKLYTDYFFIVLTSILISLIFFRKEYFKIVGTGFKALLKVILNFTGLQYFIGYKGINGAWWFTSVILVLYISYPYIKLGIEKYKIKFVLFYLVLSFIELIPLGRVKIFTIIAWGFPFVLGVYISYSNILFKIKKYIIQEYKIIKKIILFIMLIISLIIRQGLSPQGLVGIKFDYYLAFLIVLSIYVFYEDISISKNIVCFLGKKSTDIYYVHMFITTYYLSYMIYNINNVFIMIIAVVILSLIWSYLLDMIRKIINWNKLNLAINKNIKRIEE